VKKIMKRSTFIFLFGLFFIIGLSVFVFRLVTDWENWVQQPYNGHTAGSNGLVQAGKIFDRNGEVLAQTVDGERVYNDDQAVREAMLHVVGDDSLNISTAAQSIYRTKLTGYSFVWGLGMPTSLKKSNDITLTADAQACKAAYEAIGDRKGACVVYNYKTGEVICSVSTYSYDPQAPPEITEENEEQYDGVYLDHVLSSSYSPGSIFKIVTCACAIENIPDIYEREFYCEGEKEIDGSKITCVEAHGTMDFNEALAYSCNVTFAELAVELGGDKMTETAVEMGFNTSFRVDGNPTAKSNYNVANATKNQLAWSGVGQYTNLANPMQMAILCGAIANGGTTAQPYTVKNDLGILSEIGGILGQNTGAPGRLLKQDTANKLKDMMLYDVDSYYGSDLFYGLTVGAKTGTAEVQEGKEPNAWIVGFSADEEAPLAFAVVIENGGYGMAAASPVAIAAMEASVEALQK
jgi:peptidoglycan glycosyltransferase